LKKRAIIKECSFNEEIVSKEKDKNEDIITLTLYFSEQYKPKKIEMKSPVGLFEVNRKS